MTADLHAHLLRYTHQGFAIMAEIAVACLVLASGHSKAAVVLDHAEVLEYDSPVLRIAHAVCLSWSENTTEEQIVVSADSPTDPVWTPCPEPMFRRGGRLCVTVPVTQAEQYFKAVPGTQFSDDFNSVKEPFASRNDWGPLFFDPTDAARFMLTLVNEAFQIETVTRPVDGQVAIFPPGGGPVLRDFTASVDILDWASSQESALGIAGRVQGGPGRVENAYLGSVRVNPAAGTGQLWFYDGASDVQASPTFPITLDSDYRLEFSVIGRQLELRLWKLAETEVAVAQGRRQASTSLPPGRVALWVNTRGSTDYRRTLDNFSVTGTKP